MGWVKQIQFLVRKWVATQQGLQSLARELAPGHEWRQLSHHVASDGAIA